LADDVTAPITMPGKAVVKFQDLEHVLHKSTLNDMREPCCKTVSSANSSYRGFSLSMKEIRDINSWLRFHPPKSNAALSYVFAPTSIGLVTKVTLSPGEEFDFTNYDEW
jgi:hypothetical protein